MKEIDQSYCPIADDYTLILFTDSQARCRGLFDNLETSDIDNVAIFSKGYDDKNATQAQSVFGGDVFDVTNDDEMELLSKVSNNLELKDDVIVDISVLNQLETLLLMNVLDEKDVLCNTSIVYSTPEKYTDNNESVSKGIGKIESVPGFVNSSPLNQNILLIMMLGFEPARSIAIYHNYDPEKTHLVIPHPPYKTEWKSKTYDKNSRLIHEVGEKRAHNMHSIDPTKFVRDFYKMVEENDIQLNNYNTYVSPLSTKPQTVGLYYIWKKNKKDMSIIHSEPLEKNKLFISNGIQDTWEIISPEDEI
jgi:hypothetical protein